jgi:CheY-like chemotaxis protein
VDDSETNREVAYQILTGEGATVETAENGQDAMVRLMARPDYFQVVLMDVQMPVMDGYTATRQIRATPEFKNLPIIALTAGAFNSQRLSALEAGMDDFIGKPFDVEELITCVARFSKTTHEEKTPVMIIPKTVAPEDSINLTSLPLIDIENGLKRWGDAEIYQKYLRIFAEKNHENAVETQQALLDNDVKTAKAITHKLLGSGGNLALKRLVHVAAKIEACFNNDENPQEQQLVAFKETLAETIAAIKNYLISENPIVSTTEQPALVSCSKEELLKFIQALDTDNPALIEPKLYALTGKLPAQQFEDLESFINHFDFRGAESLANKLLSENFDFHQGDN